MADVCISWPGDGKISEKNGVNDKVQEFKSTQSRRQAQVLQLLTKRTKSLQIATRGVVKKQKAIGCMAQVVKGKPSSSETLRHMKFLRSPRNVCYTNNVLHVFYRHCQRASNQRDNQICNQQGDHSFTLPLLR
ncbi:hypothetical protein PoB_002823900 [Plakobranchus ocellatus]|uniref:Uncharacterized protein n=1 Tax=Plakobranchus ocellatus TaxID=259542 RepID=A0AAV4A575_9GAST|nr:hypothetical protein PoB_002823900 [Plakobranchus ocellatus]